MDILLLKYSTSPIRAEVIAMMLSAVIMGIFAVLGIKSLPYSAILRFRPSYSLSLERRLARFK